VALHHFTTVPLVYTKLYGSKNPHRGWHSFGLSGEVPPSISMWAHWLGRGEQLLVTLIYPSRDLTSEIKNVTSLCTNNSSAEKIYGFRLEMKDGSMVTYQAAQHQGELKIGALNATAESLLLMERPDGQKRGLALGVSKLTKDGQEQGFKETDFEYAIDGGEIKISGPIKYFTTRVSVKPEGGLYVAPVKTDVFYAGPVGAQIRYALDGNMPTADSPVYTGLLEIAKTATLKAQAFRDGQAEGPVTELAFTITNLPPTPPKPDVYLSDLIPEKNQQDGENHEIIRDQACWDGFRNEGLPPIRLAGKTYGKGLSQHTDAETVFELKPEYARFVAVAGVDDCTGNKGALFFRVLVDDQLLAESPILRGTAQRYWHFDCPLPSGAKRLTLFSLHSPDNVGFNMCDWAEAGFMLRKEK
jgi:hypothetical protein